MKRRFLRIVTSVILTLTLVLALMTGCSSNQNRVVIYTSMEDYCVEYLNKRISEEFPDYNVIVEYLSTGNHAARLIAEGEESECDITYDLEYGYLEQLDKADVLMDLSYYNKDNHVEDTVVDGDYIIQIRNGGGIVINTEVLKEKGLEEPKSYEDLIKPEYKGLISMPNPKSSGTGYMFLKSLVNSWGEEKAFEYFDKLTPNILQYTSSGVGPVNALLQKEVAIGLTMIAPTVTQINEGAPLKIVFFEEGAPYSLYGQAMIKRAEEKPVVKEVFDWISTTFSQEINEKYFPEKIYKDRDAVIENYPQNIKYSDMSNDTIESKEDLLSKWKY